MLDSDHYNLRRLLLKRLTQVAGSSLVIFAMPAVALAKAPTSQHTREYRQAYHSVVKQFGHRAPGRNIINWGSSPGKPATDSEVTKSLVILHRMLAYSDTTPVAASYSYHATTSSDGSTSDAPSAQVTSTRTNASTVSSGSASTGTDAPAVADSGGGSNGQWVIPASIVQCESTFQNLAPNGASASGYYQITDPTWGGYKGYASAYEAPKSVQDEKAAQLWDGGRGASQWVCKG